MITVGTRSFRDEAALEKLVVKAATEYDLNGYAEDFDGLEVTDPEYDILLRKLKEVAPDAECLKRITPSEADRTGDTVIHDPPMTSIEKADGTLEEKNAIYSDWLKRCAADLGITDKLKVVQSFKHDGVALRVNYVKGRLVSAGLRPREGVAGTDVTRHVVNIKGVPKKLPLPLTLSLNGEIECWFDDFEAINAEQDANGEEPYKNPRGYTNGCMGRDDAAETKNSRLRICYYSITGFEEWRDYYKTEIDRAKWANSPDGLNLSDEEGKGFFVQVRPHDYASLAVMEEHAKKLKYYTDGVILKVSDLDQQEQLGHHGDDTTKAPRGALAWKFAEETAEAEVSSIEWNASRTGRYVPTALFDTPFVLADSENTRATCNNFGWMDAQGLGPGAIVQVKKGGKIIPNIMKVLKPVNVVAPTHCSTCGATLALEISPSGNKDLKCRNEDCGAKHVKGWLFFLQKLGGKGLGQSAMEKILQTGKVRRISDLFKLEESDLTANGVFSERQAVLAISTIWLVKFDRNDDKLRAGIEKARKNLLKVEAAKFFGALGIPGAGDTAGKALVSHLKGFDPIREATVDELLEVDGIGQTTAEAIHAWFTRNDPNVDSLLDYFELELPKSGKLNGKNFVLTGAFEKGKKHWEKLIEDQGGNISSSVGSKTNYLIQELGKSDGSPSEKEKAALAKNVPVISVADLEKML